jgi:hypothetical protein
MPGYCNRVPASCSNAPSYSQQEQAYLANAPGASVCNWNQMMQASTQPGYHPTPFGPSAQGCAIIPPSYPVLTAPSALMTQSQWAQTGAAQVPGNTYQDYLSQLNQPISQPQACMSGMTAGLGSKGSPTYAGCGDAAAFQRMRQAYGSPVCQALQCLTANPAGSSIANLYQQDLGRTADVPGLQFWMTQLQNGNMTLCQINQAIKNSPEAKARKTS